MHRVTPYEFFVNLDADADHQDEIRARLRRPSGALVVKGYVIDPGDTAALVSVQHLPNPTLRRPTYTQANAA
jgi:hypothetical protein